MVSDIQFLLSKFKPTNSEGLNLDNRRSDKVTMMWVESDVP